MKNRIRLTMVLWCSIALSQKVTAQITPADIDQFALDEMVRQELPGLAIGVYKKGKINYTKGYGHIDLDRTIPMTKSTVFGWASISKTLTSVAVHQLAESRSDFNINDKVVKHYPFWTSNFKVKTSNFKMSRPVSDKARKEEITIKHLLTNRSGINQYSGGRKKEKGEFKNLKKESYKSDEDNFNANSSVNVFKDAKLDFDPGKEYLYSTFGFNLLGAVVDEVSGSYTGWVKANIRNKLGLNSLEVSPRSQGFQRTFDGILNEEIDAKGSKEYILPGGGWKSNIQDLLKFSKGIIDGKLLDDTSQLWANDFNQKYKRGVWIKKETDDFEVWHGGSQNDVRTMMYIMPDEDISVVIAYPTNHPARMNLVRRIIDKLGKKRAFDLTPADKCGRGMRNSKKHEFFGVWRRTHEDVVVRRGYTSENFKKEWKFLKTQGYQVFDIEVWKRSNGSIVWDGIFKEVGTGYAMWRNYDYKGFKKKWDEMISKGYRLFDLETYVVGGKRKWAGLFKKSTDKSAMWRNLSLKAFEAKRKSMQSKDLQLVDVEVYESKGQLKWSGVWLKGKKEKLNSNLDYNAFKTLIQKRFQEGYRLVDVETYKISGKQKWAGVWEKTSGAQKISERIKYCEVMKEHEEYSKKSYELIELVRFKN